MENIRLSENFWLYEFVRSQTAQRLGIDNSPSPDVVKNIKLMVDHIAQPLRTYIGRPIFVSSGYRCKALNTAIGGSLHSQHMEGKAGDFDHPTHNVDMFNFIRENLPFDQLIWEFGTDEYPGWIHCSYTPFKRRAQVLKAYRNQSGVHYVSFG